MILCSTAMWLREEKADVLREMHGQTPEKPYASETLRDLVAAAIGPSPGLAQLAQTRHQYARALRAEEMEVSTTP